MRLGKEYQSFTAILEKIVGQAKVRGTLEQRKAGAIEKAKVKSAELAEYRATISRDIPAKDRSAVLTIIGMAAAAGYSLEYGCYQ